MINDYYRFLKHSPVFFIFSISGVFFSAPGQTFLISLFKSTICQTILISGTQFAFIYSLATILASFLLHFIGKVIDTIPINKMLIINALFFSASLFIFSISTTSYLLFIALFFMRLFGQGSLPITSSTHTIKTFYKGRGSALSLTQLGYPLSEFIFPGLAIFLMSQYGFKGTFIIFSISILALYFPASYFSINHFNNSTRIKEPDPIDSKSLKFVLNDKIFFIYLSLSTIPPSIMTAAFFFQEDIFSINSWNFAAIALAISMYALFKFLSTILIGPLLDKYGVVPALFFLTFCLGFAAFTSSIFGSQFLSYIYYSFYGIGIGCAGPTMSYLWAKLYGNDHIGEIKGFISIIRNGSTAITPFVFSYMNSHLFYSFNLIFLVSGLIILAMSTIPLILIKIDPRLR